MEEKQNHFIIEETLLNNIINYLLTKPAGEVLGFIKDIETTIKPLESESSVTKDKKKQ